MHGKLWLVTKRSWIKNPWFYNYKKIMTKINQTIVFCKSVNNYCTCLCHFENKVVKSNVTHPNCICLNVLVSFIKTNVNHFFWQLKCFSQISSHSWQSKKINWQIGWKKILDHYPNFLVTTPKNWFLSKNVLGIAHKFLIGWSIMLDFHHWSNN